MRMFLPFLIIATNANRDFELLYIFIQKFWNVDLHQSKKTAFGEVWSKGELLKFI